MAARCSVFVLPALADCGGAPEDAAPLENVRPRVDNGAIVFEADLPPAPSACVNRAASHSEGFGGGGTFDDAGGRGEGGGGGTGALDAIAMAQGFQGLFGGDFGGGADDFGDVGEDDLRLFGGPEHAVDAAVAANARHAGRRRGGGAQQQQQEADEVLVKSLYRLPVKPPPRDLRLIERDELVAESAHTERVIDRFRWRFRQRSDVPAVIDVYLPPEPGSEFGRDWRFVFAFEDGETAADVFLSQCSSARGTADVSLFSADKQTLNDDDEVWADVLMASNAFLLGQQRELQQKREGFSLNTFTGLWWSVDSGVNVRDGLAECLEDGDADTRTLNWIQNLTEAVRQGNVSKVETLLNDPLTRPVSLDDHDGEAYERALQWLIRRFVLCIPIDEGGTTLLHIAAEHGYLELLDLLMTHATKTHASSHSVNLILAHISLLWQGDDGDLIPLVVADAVSNWDFFPVDFSVLDSRGWSVQHCAASAGHLRALKRLCSAGADCSLATTDTRSTVLHFLAQQDWYSADVDLKSSSGIGPLQDEIANAPLSFAELQAIPSATFFRQFFDRFAPEESESLPSEVVKLVQARGNFIDERNIDGETPLQVRLGVTRFSRVGCSLTLSPRSWRVLEASRRTLSSCSETVRVSLTRMSVGRRLLTMPENARAIQPMKLSSCWSPWSAISMVSCQCFRPKLPCRFLET
jgi:hypothetical protein